LLASALPILYRGRYSTPSITLLYSKKGMHL
jgi:hypothetical protein